MSKRKFNIGDKVVIAPKYKNRYNSITTVGEIMAIGSTRDRASYLVNFEGKIPGFRLYSYELVFADLHALAQHFRKENDKDLYSEEACKMYKQGFDDYNAHLASHKCKYCGEEFDDDLIIESTEEPGVCEWCAKYRKKMPKIHNRKSIAVDLKDFSIFGKDGDWLEVTEWTNGEGIDIDIHYNSDHEEDNRHFMLSYDELEVIMNIVNKFGCLPIIYTDKEK